MTCSYVRLNSTTHDFRLPLRCNCGIRSSGCYAALIVSYRRFRTTCQGQETKEVTLEDGAIGLPETSVTDYERYVASKKSEDFKFNYVYNSVQASS